MLEGTAVSCVMVTSAVPARMALLARSLACYRHQTYRTRELVVVLDRKSETAESELTALLRSLESDEVRLIMPPAGLSLGALRNIGSAEARGAILCQWDDDDLHHPERVERQLKALTEAKAEAVCLEEVMHLFASERTLFCTNWRSIETGGLPGTLLWRSDTPAAYPETGPASRLGEDSALVLQFRERGTLHPLAGFAHLYIYVSHGANSWGDEHHRMLVTKLGLSQGLLRRREAELRKGLAAFHFGAGELTVQGYNGPAFTL